MEENQTNNFYSNLEKYFTKRNIIISISVIVVIFFAIMFWNQYKLATIIIKPNVENVNIIVEKSILPNNGVTNKRDIYLTKNNIDELTFKLEPNFYYYIKATKDNYTSKFIAINPKFHETINLNIYLNKPLLTNSVSYPTLKDNKEIIYINTTNNKLSSYDFATQTSKELYPYPIVGIKNLIYSPKKNQAILQLINDNITFSGGYAKAINDDSNTFYQPTPSPFYKPELTDNVITTWLINFDNQEVHFINQDIRNVAWISNDQIVYDYFKVNEYVEGETLKFTNTLNIANQNGEQWQNILDLKDKFILFPKIIPSSDNQKIILIPTPLESGYEITGSLNIFDLNTKEISQLTDKQTLFADWSFDNQKILYTKIDSSKNNKPTLWLINSDGSAAKDLEIYTTNQKSCWLNNNQIMAAIPVSPQEPEKLSADNTPDNFTALKDQDTTDALYQINLDTGEKTNLFADNFQYLTNIHNIFSNEQNVYFVDGENKLYSLPLK